MIGTSLSHYTILEKIGAGGMGVVYKARDMHLDRFVALKVLAPEKVADVKRKRLFVHEAKCASAINHPNIITIYDISCDGGLDFIAMEFVQGKTLAELIPKKGLRVDCALRYAAQIAAALTVAHSAGIIHRDLKPGNVMASDDGLIKVLDFGLAKLTESSLGESVSAIITRDFPTEEVIIGTAPYMSPEQVERRELDTHSDIFSFGALLYEMLTGRKAFQRASNLATLAAILREEPTPVCQITREVPSEVERIINRCLRKNPQDRIHNTSDLKLALDELSRSVASPSQTISSASIAVMPFVNMNRDEESEFLSDGITEDIINALMRVEGIRVAARSSVFQFKGRVPEVREVGHKLNVDAVLEGSVRRSAERLRVTVQLIKAVDGFQIWSERYDRVMKDIFEIQDEISRSIVNKLKVRLVDDRSKPIVRQYTTDHEAYGLYLKGRHQWHKRTAAGYRKSADHFEQACAKDPGFALPFAGLADAYLASAWWGSVNPVETIPKVEALLKRALEIDASLGEAYASLGFLYGGFLWDWDKAETAFLRSIELNPNYAPARLWHACVSLGPSDRLEEASREAERAVELEPLVTIYYGAVCLLPLWRRQYDLAQAIMWKTMELEPDFALGFCVDAEVMSYEGSHEKAVAAAEKASRSLPPGGFWGTGLLGYCYARCGKTEEARNVLANLETLRKHSYAQATALAAVYVGLGEKDLALEWLERAYREHCGQLCWIRFDSTWDSLRDDPRFRDLLHRMNLAP